MNKPAGKKEPEDQKGPDLVKVLEAMQAVGEQVKSLAEGLETVSGSVKAQQQRFDEFVASAREEPKGGKKPAQGSDVKSLDEFSDQQLEGMSRRELVKFMADQLTASVSKLIEPIKGQVQGVSQNAALTKARQELNEAKNKYPDFLEWREEIQELANANPQMSLEDLYHVARRHDEDKAKKMDEKHAAKDDEPKAEEGGGKPPAGFGGMKPGGNAPRTVENSGSLSREDAADVAWEETMSGIDMEQLMPTGDQKQAS